MSDRRPNPPQQKAVAVVVRAPVAVADERRDFLRKVYAPGVGDQDFERFLAEADRWDLDITKKEIWAIPGFGTDENGQPRPALIFPAIAGFRKLADQTGLVDGTIGPEFAGPDLKWLPVWPHGAENPPAFARFTIYRKDRALPTVAIAKYVNRVNKDRYGKPLSKWKTQPDEMLGINAERMAYRLAGLIHDAVRAEYTGTGVDERTVALRRLHATAVEKGLNHEQVRQVMTGFATGETSMAALDAGTIHMAADLIDGAGANALPDDPITGTGPEESEKRRAFIERIGQGEQAKNKQAFWKGLMEAADGVSGGWELLIEHAPSVVYARRLVEIAVKEHGVRQETADRALAAREAAEERKETPPVPESADPPPAQAAMDIPPGKASEPAITDYAAFKALLKERGLDPAAYTDLVGKEPSQFATWDMAMAALNRAYAEMEGVVGDETEGEFTELDADDVPVDPENGTPF